MRAGRLRHRITIQEFRVTGRNVIGGEVKDWVNVATVWAGIEPIRGREYLAADQPRAELTHRVPMRYRPGIVPTTMRVKYGSRVFDIKSVIDPDERHVDLELMCTEAVGTSGA
jgi:SPP1 family predicted phage head-tail adaptor